MRIISHLPYSVERRERPWASRVAVLAGSRSMRLLCLALSVGAVGPLTAQLQLVPDEWPQSVFAGEGRAITLRWHNPGPQPVTAEIRARLSQIGSSVAAPYSEAAWKKLTVLPGQTVLETATIDFPLVRGKTRFLVQWVTANSRVLGTTEVLAYSPDVLGALKPLVGETGLGVFDPQNLLKPLLKKVAVEILDLEDVGLDHFDGKLAVVGPFASRNQVREGFAGSIKALAGKGVAVVWIQPPPEKHRILEPSFYTAREGKGTVVVVQPELMEGVAQRPEPQLALLALCRLAANPQPFRFPDILNPEKN